MILERLSVIQYKNIQQADLQFSPKINCFFGKNGMGKTNLLDAVYYLSFCKSHRNLPDTQNIMHDQEFFVIQGSYQHLDEHDEIYCGYRKRQKKQFKRNKKEYDKLSDHIGSIPLVIISPADAILIQGGSEERRRFIDQVISQYDKNYLEALVTYQHALTQRNALLKNEQSADPELFDLWEEVLDRNARKIHRTREEFIAEFIPVFQHYYRQISGEAETTGLEYISHLQAETSLQELLRTNRDRDKLMGYTTKGIHKDELEMTLSSLPIRKIGSQGQNKTYLIALKLAQFDFLKRNSTRIPLLLLDDIFDKLDSLRVEEIIKLVGGEQFGQIFITDTDRNYLDEILARTPQNYRLFKVEAGEITPLDKA